MKVVSTFHPSDKKIKAIEEAFPNIQFAFHQDINAAKNELSKAEILLTYGGDLTPELINRATNLKWIMVASAGLEKMPLSACKDKGIIVTNARGIHKVPMAEFVLGSMLQYVKQARVLWKNEQGREWQRRLPMAELKGKAILIIGVGAIGGEIARLAKAFQMKTYGINTTGHPVEHVDEAFKLEQLIEVLPCADFVVNCLPSTKATIHLLKETHFAAMQNSAVFINIGRGDVVEERVLLEALKNKEIAYAYLDVFEHEPLPQDHPFWTMENVSVTPHISSLTKQYVPRAFEIFAENLHRYLNKSSDLINKIDLERGY